MHARRIRVKRFPKRKKGALLVYVAQCMLHFFLPFTIHYKCMSSCENSPRVIRCETESATYKLRNASYEVTDSNLRNHQLLIDRELVQWFSTKKLCLRLGLNLSLRELKSCALTNTPLHMSNGIITLI